MTRSEYAASLALEQAAHLRETMRYHQACMASFAMPAPPRTRKPRGLLARLVSFVRGA